MSQQLFPGIYRGQIPLPRNPLKAVNSYAIKGDGRFLIIDTGMRRQECLQPMLEYLASIDVDLDCTDFFISHFHADHLGLVSELFRSDSRVYISADDDVMFRDPNNWSGMAETARINGFPEYKIEEAIKRHPGFKYHAGHTFESIIIHDGDMLEIGGYRLQCVATPGHTPGHMCMYEPEQKILFSGDHILETITPNISLWAEHRNPLKEYLKSLEKIHTMEISHVLPGHREPFTHYRRRIDELRKHHETRNAEILSILKEGDMSAWQVASRMTWDIKCDNWEEFPLPQQWFASGEALAHLQYLAGEGLVHRTRRHGKALFSLSEQKNGMDSRYHAVEYTQ
jgi:glyoxylase-like metal-dependent hydrolase (beta-lactamase superfamily II)